MAIGLIALIVCGGLGAVILFSVLGYGINLYNGIIRLKNIVDEAWSGIDVQLKRRYDLIPNLVETVKAYASHESETFEKIAELRSGAMNASGVEEKGVFENQITGALKTLFAVAENYPELKANTNFLELQDDLNKIEDEIQKARRYYNGTVRDFNIKIEVFPANILVGFLGFSSREFFEIENEEERDNVKVDFGKKEEKK